MWYLSARLLACRFRGTEWACRGSNPDGRKTREVVTPRVNQLRHRPMKCEGTGWLWNCAETIPFLLPAHEPPSVSAHRPRPIFTNRSGLVRICFSR